jgi:hypothetical protein
LVENFLAQTKKKDKGEKIRHTKLIAKMQLLVSSIDGRLLSFSFPSELVTLELVKRTFEEREGVPANELRVSCNGRCLPDDHTFAAEHSFGLPPLRVGLKLVGGKGGFGSLLRGGNTKVGQKKVRQMHLHRTLRHGVFTLLSSLDDQLRRVPRFERTEAAPCEQREATG